MPLTSIETAGWQCAVQAIADAIFNVDGDQRKVTAAEINSNFSGLCVGENLLACKRIESIKVPRHASVIYSRINQKKEQMTRCVYGTLHGFSSSLQKVDVQKNLI